MNTESNPSETYNLSYLRTLADFQKFNVLCDGRIELSDHSVIPVHKAVLALKSIYFRTLFTTPIHNKVQNQFQISEISHDVMQEVINYCYDDNVCVTNQNAYELLKIADYFNIPGLEEICVEYLAANLNSNNCMTCLNFAEDFYCFKLASKAKYYLNRYFEQIIRESDDLLKLEAHALYKLLKSDHLNVKTEECVWEFIVRWIEHDPEHRKKFIDLLILAPRLGLLNTDYFVMEIQHNPYVQNVPSVKTIVIKTLQFLYDLDTLNENRELTLPQELTTPRLPYEILLVLGGWSGGSPTSVIETYDTRADRWTKIDVVDPLGPRAYHGLVAIRSYVYVIGGFDGIEYFNTCRKFDAETREWSSISPMHFKRCYVSVAVLNDMIYAMGGYDGSTRQNTAEKYDPITNQWTMIASMNAQRSDADACTLNNRIYITGGFNGQECLNSAEIYDPEKNRWTLIEPMRSRRSGVSCIGFDNKIFVLGGFNGVTRMNSCESYDPISKTWSAVHDMYSTRSNFAVEIIDDLIFAIGGFNGVTTIFHVECYDKKSCEWYEATDMLIYRSALSACVLRELSESAIEYFMFKNRQSIAEERKLKLIGHLVSTSPSNDSSDVNNNLENNIDFNTDDLIDIDDINNNNEDDFQNVIFQINNLDFDEGFDADIDEL